MREPMFNVDRWLNYSRQRKIAQGNFAANLYDAPTEITPKQRRRIKKKSNKRQDFSLGVSGNPPKHVRKEIGRFVVEVDDNPANHEFDCTCIFCIPGA